MKSKKKTKLKNQIIVVPTTSKSARKTAPKTKKSKISSIDYYNCLLTQAQNNWLDPASGTKKKITQCCKDCRLNAPALNEVRNQEIKKLIISYQQVGDSLAKLLRPLDK